MPDLSTLPGPAPPTRPARANTALQLPTATASSDQSASGFLGQLQQSLAAPDTSAAGAELVTAALVVPGKSDAQPAVAQIGGQASPASDLAVPPPVGRKTGVRDRFATLDRAPDAKDTAAAASSAAPLTAAPLTAAPLTAAETPPSPAAVPALVPNPAVAPALVPNPVAQDPQQPPVEPTAPEKSGNDAKAAETTTPLTQTATNAGSGRPKLGADPSPAPADPSVPSATDKPSPDPTTQATLIADTLPAASIPTQPTAPRRAIATGSDPLPTSRALASGASAEPGSPEIRRTKSVADVPAAANPAGPAEPASLTTVAAPSTSVITPPHLATSPPPQAASSSTAQAPQTTAPPSPAIQIAQAVVDPIHVVLATSPQQVGGPHVTTIQLDPIELGRVDIRIERSDDGSAKVALAAERPETLLRLVHDQPQLQQALDQAGVPQHGRTITFSLATDNGTTGSFSSNAGSGGLSNGNGQRSQQGYANPHAASADVADPLLATPVWSRTGLDITA